MARHGPGAIQDHGQVKGAAGLGTLRSVRRLEADQELDHNAEGILDLVQMTVSWQGEDGVPQGLPTHSVRLPLLPSVAYADLPEDPLVV
ncbi:MAG: hypothetical protein WCO20_10340, partial [Holophagaceae bacterium]